MFYTNPNEAKNRFQVRLLLLTIVLITIILFIHIYTMYGIVGLAWFIVVFLLGLTTFILGAFSV